MGSNILPYKIVTSAVMALNLYIFTDTITHINEENYGKKILKQYIDLLTNGCESLKKSYIISKTQRHFLWQKFWPY